MRPTYRPMYYLSSLIYLVVGLAEVVLLLRIVLRLFAANPTASFVHWTYTTSDTLLQPFRGIFPSTVIDKAYVLDFTALFALIVYGLFGSVLVYVVEWIDRAATISARPKK
jgi:uncharacterized protein YggT (Ycf19 family)